MTRRVSPLAALPVVGGIVLLAGGLSADDAPRAERFGFQVGQQVPNCAMSVIYGKLSGVHTCLTGKYRHDLTVSVYAYAADDELFRLMKVVDDRMQRNPQLRGFLLLFCDRQNREAMTARIKQLSKKHALSQVDVALATPRKEWLNLPLEAKATVIYSNQRKVRLRRVFQQAIDADDLKRLADELAELTAADAATAGTAK